MNKKLIFLFLLLPFLKSYAQSQDQVFTIVQQEPEFPGGQNAMYDYIYNNMTRPEGYINATVYIQLIISKTGAVSSYKILKGPDAVLDSAAIKCARSFPAWTPGVQDGKKVNVAYNIPFSFRKKE